MSTSAGSGPNPPRSIDDAGVGSGGGGDSHRSAALHSVRAGRGGLAGRGVQTRCVRLRDGGDDGETTPAGLGGLPRIRNDSLRCRRGGTD